MSSDVQPASASPITVLIVDDQPDLRAAIRDVLSLQPDFEVVGDLPDAASCLDYLRSHEPDILVLDVNMPGGGPSMVRQVKELTPITYVLVYSARQEPAVSRGMLDAGADAFLMKTGRLQPLLDALAKVQPV